MSFCLSPVGLAGGESGAVLHVFFFLDAFCCGSGKSKSTSAAFFSLHVIFFFIVDARQEIADRIWFLG